MASFTPHLESMQGLIAAWREAGDRIAFVPTMGGLHRGHASLIEQAAAAAQRVVVSIFVNPTQFAAGEDLDTYPRDAEGDVAIAQAAGADLLWFCGGSDIYPPGFSSFIHPQGPGLGLETDYRPHFFRGVATVVARLFALVRPDIAVFGEKDFQQLLVVQQLVKDFGLDVVIQSGALIRDPSGLALSSRNQYLNDEALAEALAVPRSLQQACELYAGGERDPEVIASAARRKLASSGLKTDYFEVRRAADLAPLDGPIGSRASDWRFLVAAHCRGVRLIDNCSPDNPPWP